jgi:hypothetical protein
VKRFVLIFLLALYLVSSTEVKQFLKFPVLFEHYAEHKTSNEEISFLDFIYMHYAGTDFDENDEDRDMQLPFKSTSFTSPDLFTFFPAHNSIFLKQGNSEKSELIVKEESDFPPAYLSSIWQPPKAC